MYVNNNSGTCTIVYNYSISFRVLLDRGADANKEDSTHCIPSFLAQRYGHNECYRTLTHHLKEKVEDLARQATEVRNNNWHTPHTCIHKILHVYYMYTICYTYYNWHTLTCTCICILVHFTVHVYIAYMYCTRMLLVIHTCTYAKCYVKCTCIIPALDMPY